MALVMSAVFAAPALAHAELVAADPAPGEVVAGPVDQIILTFDSTITPMSQIQLIASDFGLAASWSQSVKGATLTATLDEPLPSGTYTLTWTAVSPDSHMTTGSFQFGVAQAKPRLPTWLVWILMVTGLAALMVGVLVWRRRYPAA